MPGVFGAADAGQRSIMRVVSAVGGGATAVRLVHEYLAAPLAANSAERLLLLGASGPTAR